MRLSTRFPSMAASWACSLGGQVPTTMYGCASNSARWLTSMRTSSTARPALSPDVSPTPWAGQGPAMMIDTSCSSSLVALHQACQSLRSALKRDLALAGGVNLILSPYGFVLVSKLRAVASDGRCKTFDAAADGYGRGEGCVVLVLRRLADAERDRDPGARGDPG
ncbi:beta-ketoacyl synthase N-terminal-like domain-containing protein [Pseudomonas aeruginosa]